MLISLQLMLLGILAGILSGFFGIGGGLIIVPALVFFFGLTQHQAQGTSLAVLLPPVGLLAATYYYRHGNVNIGMAAWIALGLFLGGLIGAMWVQKIDAVLAKRLFGILFCLVGLKMIFWK